MAGQSPQRHVPELSRAVARALLLVCRFVLVVALKFIRIVVMALLAFSAWRAHAHDARHPELNDWFMGLKNHKGYPCCDGSDATRLEDPDWENVNGHYRVRLEGEWVEVPDDAVVDGVNRLGPALVWPYYLDGKLVGIRCFMPGAMA